MTAPDRRFHLGEILTAATGIYLCPNGLDGFRQFVRHVTGEAHLTHQLGRAGQDIAPHIREQFPWIAEIGDIPPITSEADGLAFLAETAAKYGEYHEVTPMPPGMYVAREPIAEFREMAPHTEIIAVEVDL